MHASDLFSYLPTPQQGDYVSKKTTQLGLQTGMQGGGRGRGGGCSLLCADLGGGRGIIRRGLLSGPPRLPFQGCTRPRLCSLCSRLIIRVSALPLLAVVLGGTGSLLLLGTRLLPSSYDCN